jgi:hypothetical protein
MRTNRIIQLSLFILGMLAISLTGCKKNTSSTTQPTDNTTSIQNLSTDESRVNQAYDEANNDVNNVLNGPGALKSTESIPCHANLDSIRINNDTIMYYITYDGLNCNGHLVRTGRVEIKKHVNTYWYQAGTSIICTFINFRVWRQGHPEKAITINGRRKYTNVTGGLLFMLGQNDSIIHTEEGYMNLIFEDSTHRTWNFNRHLIFTRVNQMLVLKTSGLGNADGYNNLVIWGVNRNGEQFYDQLILLNVFKQQCDWDPCEGQRKIMIPAVNKSATLTWGYDKDNQLITNGDCPTKFRVDWSINGQSGTIYLDLP